MGEPESWSSGAVRDSSEGKPRYDLIPPSPMRRMGMVYYEGAQHYGEHNWSKGMPTSRCLASLLRHVEAARSGDTSEDHWAKAVWNIFAIMHFQGTEWDDLYQWTNDAEK